MYVGQTGTRLPSYWITGAISTAQSNRYRPDRNNITGYPLQFIHQNPVDIGQTGAGLHDYRISGEIFIQ